MEVRGQLHPPEKYPRYTLDIRLDGLKTVMEK
jgi:hypothetical protein